MKYCFDNKFSVEMQSIIQYLIVLHLLIPSKFVRTDSKDPDNSMILVVPSQTFNVDDCQTIRAT